MPARQLQDIDPVVYFIGAHNHPIKIGKATRVERRLAELQVGCPRIIHVLATTPGGFAMEREYHQRFIKHLLHGEWFSRHPDILAEIKRLRLAEFAASAAPDSERVTPLPSVPLNRS